MRKRFKKKSKIKQILKFTIITLFVITLFGTIQHIEKESEIKSSEDLEKIYTPEITEEKQIIEKSEEPIVIDEYQGYKVAAFLEIPEIDLATNVLEEYSVQGLAKCVSKFWGTNANEVGNFCIAGHNYKKPNMFNNVYKLKIGDNIYLTDNKNGRVEYEIYNIYKEKPEETSSLSQKTEGRREITLITCSANAKYRIIVKAKEI